MIVPKKIKKGDTVGLVCPSSNITEERKEKCIKAISDLGFRALPADNLTDSYAGYMAGKSHVRGEWINKMFANPEVDAIFCIRGGDGSSRIMEYLDLDIIKRNPKIFVGYSDITNLHLLLNQKCDLVTYHGPMVSSNMVDNFPTESRESFLNTLGQTEGYCFVNQKGYSVETLLPGNGEGTLIGGNLSLLSASIGTPYEVDTDGKILFIEEVEEPLTKIDKWIYHLRNSGKFKRVKGILLGQFTDIGTSAGGSYSYLDSVKDAVAELGIPVLYNIQSGHGDEIMTLPLGAKCFVDSDKREIRFSFAE